MNFLYFVVIIVVFVLFDQPAKLRRRTIAPKIERTRDKNEGNIISAFYQLQSVESMILFVFF